METLPDSVPDSSVNHLFAVVCAGRCPTGARARAGVLLSLYPVLSVQLVLLPTCPQVRDLCLGIPYDLEAPDGYELDEFLGHKNHPLARMLRDFTDGDNVRAQTLPFVSRRCWAAVTVIGCRKSLNAH